MAAIVSKDWGGCGLLGIQVDPLGLSQHHTNHSTAARWLLGTANRTQMVLTSSNPVPEAAGIL